MDIHLGRVAFWVAESDFVALVHQGANRNRELVEVVACAGINLAIFQGQAMTARDQYQDFSFRCHCCSPFRNRVCSPDMSVKDPLSKIQSDTRVWLGTAYEHVPRGGPLQRFRVVSDRSGNQTSHARVAGSSPARPADGDRA